MARKKKTDTKKAEKAKKPELKDENIVIDNVDESDQGKAEVVEAAKPKTMTKEDGIAACILKLQSSSIPAYSKMRIVSILAKELKKEPEVLLELYTEAKKRLSPVFNKVQYDAIEKEIEYIKNENS